LPPFKLKLNLYSPVIVLLFRILVIMILFSICRVLFYSFNSGLFPGMTLKQFMIILLGGLRFDLSAVLYINLLYALLQLIPFKFRYSPNYQKPLDYLFFLTNGIGLALNCIDFVYYRFTQRRMTLLVFEEFKNETNYLQLLKHFFIDYYFFFLLFLFLILTMIWAVKKFRVRGTGSGGIKYYILNTILLLVLSGLMIIGLRSGLPPKQDFPLFPSDAGQYVSNPNDIAIVQNTPFCIFMTLSKPVLKKVDYFSDEELASIYTPLHYPDSLREVKRMNVIVIMVESFGRETIGFYNRNLDGGTYKGYTPFIDSICENSHVFLNSFANSRISIEGSPAVIASIPSLQESYTLTLYSNNKINSLPSCLSKNGYETLYAHGAPNGSLGLNAFTVMAGIDKYIGYDEYANSDDFDGVWGIWDHKFLPFFARECSKLNQPFQATVFTLSSHHPFKLPPDYLDTHSEKDLPIFKSIRYIDYSLRTFFVEAAKQPWYNNTLFVITGDHTCSRFHEVYNTSLGAFGVPIIFYTPGKQLAPERDERVAQQIDIMPTVLNFFGYDKPYFAFGKDLFNKSNDNIAINYIGNAFQMVCDDWVIQYNGSVTIGLYDWKKDPLLAFNLVNKKPDKQAAMERKLKAFIQQFNNRMQDNLMVPLLANPKYISGRTLGSGHN
jgi:arylsulfatase A-like enzyme